MIRAALALTLLASPAAAVRQPEAFPVAYLVAVVIGETNCRLIDIAVYGVREQACLIGGQAEIASRLRPGEVIEEMWCE